MLSQVASSIKMGQDPGKIPYFNYPDGTVSTLSELLGGGIRGAGEKPLLAVLIPSWERGQQREKEEIKIMKEIADAPDDMLAILVKGGLQMNSGIDPATGETIFTHALRTVNKTRIETTLKLGADINEGMIVAIKRLFSLDIVKILLELGADVNKALSTALTTIHYPISLYLIQNGANPNFKIGDDDWTPLMCLVNTITANQLDASCPTLITRGNPLGGPGGECLTYLLNTQFDKNMAGKSGLTPVIIVAKAYAKWYSEVVIHNQDVTDVKKYTPLLANILILLGKAGLNMSLALPNGETAGSIIGRAARGIRYTNVIWDLKDAFLNNGESFTTAFYQPTDPQLINDAKNDVFEILIRKDPSPHVDYTQAPDIYIPKMFKNGFNPNVGAPKWSPFNSILISEWNIEFTKLLLDNKFDPNIESNVEVLGGGVHAFHSLFKCIEYARRNWDNRDKGGLSYGKSGNEKNRMQQAKQYLGTIPGYSLEDIFLKSQGGSYSYLNYGGMVEVFELLCDNGANINAKMTGTGLSVLQFAKSRNIPEIVTILKKKGAIDLDALAASAAAYEASLAASAAAYEATQPIGLAKASAARAAAFEAAQTASAAQAARNAEYAAGIAAHQAEVEKSRKFTEAQFQRAREFLAQFTEEAERNEKAQKESDDAADAAAAAEPLFMSAEGKAFTPPGFLEAQRVEKAKQRAAAAQSYIDSKITELYYRGDPVVQYLRILRAEQVKQVEAQQAQQALEARRQKELEVKKEFDRQSAEEMKRLELLYPAEIQEFTRLPSEEKQPFMLKHPELLQAFQKLQGLYASLASQAGLVQTQQAQSPQIDTAERMRAANDYAKRKKDAEGIALLYPTEIEQLKSLPSAEKEQFLLKHPQLQPYQDFYKSQDQQALLLHAQQAQQAQQAPPPPQASPPQAEAPPPPQAPPPQAPPPQAPPPQAETVPLPVEHETEQTEMPVEPEPNATPVEPNAMPAEHEANGSNVTEAHATNGYNESGAAVGGRRTRRKQKRKTRRRSHKPKRRTYKPKRRR